MCNVNFIRYILFKKQNKTKTGDYAFLKALVKKKVLNKGGKQILISTYNEENALFQEILLMRKNALFHELMSI